MEPNPDDNSFVVTTTTHDEDGSMTLSTSDNTMAKDRLHWWNTGAFAINAIITYGVGTLGWFGALPNSEISEKYQSLITPNSTAFSIWAVIFISQAIATGIQWLPAFRKKTLIHRGVGFYYIGTCVFQAAWTISFAFQVIWLSLIWMISIWWTLFAIAYRHYYLMMMNRTSATDFWLVVFPFAIHFGWITAALALNIDVLVIDQGGSAAVQLAAAIVSLAALHAASVWAVFGISQPNYTVAAVVAWATWWIFQELKTPNSLIVETFPVQIIQGVSYAAATVAVIVLIQIAVRVFVASMQLLKDHDEEATTAPNEDISEHETQPESDHSDGVTCAST